MVDVREVQHTANGFVSADKVVTVTTCLTGDTLVVAHANTANPFAADPISTAGTLTLEATVTNGFAGRCRLRVFTCPVGADGTYTVTFPYTDNVGGGAGDNHGSVVVLGETLLEDGTSTNAGVDGQSATSVMNTLTTVGADDLLVAFFAAFVTDAQASYFSAGSSGMTLQAQSFDAGFLQLATFTEQLAAGGATGTRSVVPVTSDNRFVSVGIALQPTFVAVGAGPAVLSSTSKPRVSSSTGSWITSSSGGVRVYS